MNDKFKHLILMSFEGKVFFNKSSKVGNNVYHCAEIVKHNDKAFT